jgi:hypothetical protein
MAFKIDIYIKNRYFNKEIERENNYKEYLYDNNRYIGKK